RHATGATGLAARRRRRIGRLDGRAAGRPSGASLASARGAGDGIDPASAGLAVPGGRCAIAHAGGSRVGGLDGALRHLRGQLHAADALCRWPP
ncbi:hypothetical protein ABTD73_19085, partial [Acinetobacter baumannii]